MARRGGRERPELMPEAMRAFAHRTVDWMADYLDRGGREPIWHLLPSEEVFRALEEALPEEGISPEAAFRVFEEKIVRYATHLQHPGNFAYIPNSTGLLGVVADALASTLNQNVSIIRGGPSAAAVEKQVVAWLREGLELSARCGGILVSGGSTANLMALALARDRAGAERELAVFASSEVHSSVHRALRFLGLPPSALREVAMDQAYRMNPRSLEEAVARARAEGRRPAAVVASAGTIGSGAVDPLEDIAVVCEREGLWLHVDGAYGALAALAPSGAWMRAGLACADSLSLDPHKWLFVPIDTSCLFVRDAEHMRRFFSYLPDYLKVDAVERSDAFHHPMEHTIELTRRFRALRIWMTVKVLGLRTIRETIDSHLRMARELGSWVDADAGFELLAPVLTSTVCFRRVPRTVAALGDREREGTLDRLNENILTRLNQRGDLFLSHARLGGVFALRVCVTHLRTSEEDVKRLWAAVRRASEEAEKVMGLA